MPTPPVILEPLSTGDIIDRSVRIYRQNLRPLLATVAIPFVVGSIGWLMMQLGKNNLSLEEPDESTVMALVLMGLGFVITIGYAYLMVLVVAGLSRAVGDHIMLGEPITARAAMRAVRSRIGELTIGSLFLLLAFIVIGAIGMGVMFVALMVIGTAGALLGAMGFPPAVAAAVIVIVVLVALAAIFFFVVPLCIARVLFVPQAIMIEGCSATEALSRAMSLGAGNWNRVLSILIFSYFTSLSLVAALLLPIGLALWLTGYLSFDEETVDAVTGGVNQFSSFLVVPVWAIAYTLLYFDNRVRKEGYDVDLLARRLPPPPAPRPAQAGYAVPAFSATPFAAPGRRAKFAPDGRCLRCGRYNVFNTPSCPGCGW
jgi:hypothetical protein